MCIERRSSQAGLFDPRDRERALAKIRRPLDRMNEVVDWEMFQPVLRAHLKCGKSPGPDRPAKDPLLKIKMCVLQDLHGLSDEETEFYMLDGTSFPRLFKLSALD